MDAIYIESVSDGTRGAWYDEYRRLRYRVFVVEQAWTGLSSGAVPATIPDPADAGARFWLARSTDRTLVGAVRIRPVGGIFPHERLFCHHLARREMAAMLPWMGTLNSLVVEREWRGRRCLGSNGQEATVASLLLRAGLSESAGTAIRAIVATAQTLVSARALMRSGFRVIDPPVRTHLHAVFPMCNVGIVLDGREPRGRALATYFDDCQRQVLNSASIDQWFSDPLAFLSAPRDPGQESSWISA
jgi:N-acyl-L-homoserine lactone synthetase